MKLADLAPGRRAVVTGFSGGLNLRRRLQDLGLICGTSVECVGRSPLGDPAAYLIRKAVIALRREDARHILVREADLWEKS